jgi:hypothetical protein
MSTANKRFKYDSSGCCFQTPQATWTAPAITPKTIKTQESWIMSSKHCAWSDDYEEIGICGLEGVIAESSPNRTLSENQSAISELIRV